MTIDMGALAQWAAILAVLLVHVFRSPKEARSDLVKMIEDQKKALADLALQHNQLQLKLVGEYDNRDAVEKKIDKIIVMIQQLTTEVRGGARGRNRGHAASAD